MQRDKAEQIEKARLRHKHALAQLQLEEVRFSERFLVTSQYSRTLLVYCYWGTEYINNSHYLAQKYDRILSVPGSLQFS